MLIFALAVGLSVPSAEAARLPQPIYFWGSIAAPVKAPYNPVVIRPSSIGLFADGSWFLEHLHWSGWGSSVAHAKGISNASNGIPSQAQGKRITTAAQLTLYNPGRFEGREVYRCFKLTVPAPAHIGPLCLVGRYVPPPTQATSPGTQPSASPSCSNATVPVVLTGPKPVAVTLRFVVHGVSCNRAHSLIRAYFRHEATPGYCLKQGNICAFVSGGWTCSFPLYAGEGGGDFVGCVRKAPFATVKVFRVTRRASTAADRASLTIAGELSGVPRLPPATPAGGQRSSTTRTTAPRSRSSRSSRRAVRSASW
jgi:hypothetical protein